mmetsp:Transcript_57482/g.160018  ORF Transcript_57482/g.160018 Transcript_57482/m.160018 type:complete len:618 (-) Transcript_57482:163-2016(-)
MDPELRALLGRRLLVTEGKIASKGVRTVPATPTSATPIRAHSPDAQEVAFGEIRARFRGFRAMDKEREERGHFELKVGSTSLWFERVFPKIQSLRDRLSELGPDHAYAEEREAVCGELDHLLAELGPSTGVDGEAPRSRLQANVVSAEEHENVQAELRCLREENEALAQEVAELRKATEQQECSEGRLRYVMTSRKATTPELRNAIGAVEALVDEARRELNAAQLRERRAAYEQLHAALNKEEETDLVAALDVAKETEVDLGEIIKAENKLMELRALTPEQKAAKHAVKLESKRKKEAFVLVKRDDSDGMQALIESLDEGTRWQDWRDYAGRSLWRCAQELRAMRVQKYLGPLTGMKANEDGRRFRPPARSILLSESSITRQESEESQNGVVVSAEPGRAGGSAVATSMASSISTPAAETKPPAAVKHVVPAVDDTSFDSCVSPATPMASSPSQAAAMRTPNGKVRSPRTPGSSCFGSSLVLHGDEPESELRAKALRAVAQDDSESLAEVLRVVDTEVWSKWENKAGKDLLTLSQERGSSLAYSLLARGLGVLKELQRQSFEEREAVWVFEVGEVQPRRATIMEDTPEEADDILVEFWDGDAPACRVERCLVRKMWG